MERDEKKYRQVIADALDSTLTAAELPLPGKKRGKVRDSWHLGDRMLFITTDRQSAFDRVLASVPFKGQVLNLVSAWWFERTAHIIGNHMVSVPDPQALEAVACTPFPIEFVIRGYLTGSTDTSLWTRYNSGERSYCGIAFPDGMTKHQALEKPVITPTTKEEHDRPISPDEIISEGWMTREDWEHASAKALELFTFGVETARKNGLMLVDTKYEMGKDRDGNILLIDEIHTPDSSRYWLADSYEQRIAEGKDPENIDKEFLRLWFRDHCDPYHDEVLPEAPADLITELSYRYILLYEMITGESFEFLGSDISPAQRLEENLKPLIDAYKENK